MDSWIHKIEDGKLSVELSSSLYPWDVVIAALYPFTAQCFIFPKRKDAEMICILFEQKPGTVISLSDIAKNFANALIDQKLRSQLNREFGPIRNAIVERAFAPVTKSISS